MDVNRSGVGVSECRRHAGIQPYSLTSLSLPVFTS